MAWATLGLAPCADADVVTAHYRELLRTVHPDVSPRPDATERTVELNLAFRAVREAMLMAGPWMEEPARDAIGIVLLDDDTIGVAAPHGETYLRLVEACHQLGEVTHIEPGSGLLSVVVSFVEAPTCQLLLTLQGRATGLTEVFCTIDSLSSAPAPPVADVTRLLFDELVATNR